MTAYHGLIFIDDRRHFIHRITLHADGIPPAFPVQDVSLMLDYEYTRIGDADYLLPLNFELRSREGNAPIKNDVITTTIASSPRIRALLRRSARAVQEALTRRENAVKGYHGQRLSRHFSSGGLWYFHTKEVTPVHVLAKGSFGIA